MDKYKDMIELLRKMADVKRLLAQEGTYEVLMQAADAIERLERKYGKWEEIEIIQDAYDIAGVKTWASKMRCDQCGFTTFAIEGGLGQYKFCPSCGADMRGNADG